MEGKQGRTPHKHMNQHAVCTYQRIPINSLSGSLNDQLEARQNNREGRGNFIGDGDGAGVVGIFIWPLIGSFLNL